VNRTVGLTLRRTAGGGVIFALGFGAISAGPHQLVALSAAPAVLPQTSLATEDDRVVPRQARIAAVIYTEAVSAPTPAPARATPVAAPVRGGAVARVPAGPAWAVGSVSGASNGFTYGYCTWWVAHKRYVPWRGNAAQWWWNARPFGYAEGGAPRAGAIMVMGYSGSSPQGHVAYVESVNPNGSFLVSEMNWWGVPGGGWGRVDYRTVSSLSGVLGFIY
jgi:surface antigen